MSATISRRDAGVVVCHIGEGSDELFFGYESWRSLLRLQSLDDRTGMPWASTLTCACASCDACRDISIISFALAMSPCCKARPEAFAYIRA